MADSGRSGTSHTRVGSPAAIVPSPPLILDLPHQNSRAQLTIGRALLANPRMLKQPAREFLPAGLAAVLRDRLTLL